jgi:hypothetical protein
MLRSTLTRAGLMVTVGVFAAGLVAGQAGALSATPPHIVATPNNLMVNTKTVLRGTGFPARSRLTIEECSMTNWVVTAKPCDTTNQISVLTDGHGRFTRQFKVELCGGKRGPEPTSQICYIGEPHPEGIDTITLIGAAKVTVTYP